MIKKTTNYSGATGVNNVVNLGYIYNEADRQILVPPSVNPILKDTFGNISYLDLAENSDRLLLVEVNIYSGFETTLELKINRSSVLLLFSLEETELPAFGISYKYYRVGGYNNYVLAIACAPSVTSISIPIHYVKKVGNCLGNKKGQIIGYSNIINNSLNSYRTLTTKNPSALDNFKKPTSPFLESNSLDVITYKVG